MLFNEPKLLKCWATTYQQRYYASFSALQRAEIAEILAVRSHGLDPAFRFSALQRAEIAEIQTSTKCQ